MLERASTGQSTIRRAEPGEAEALTALSLRSKAYWGYDESFMTAAAAELALSPERLARCPAYVLEAEGRVAGFYLLEPIDEREVELSALFVEPDAIGRGYGRRLMEHAITTAKRLGYRAMLVHSDPNAEPFYRAMGAELIGTVSSGSIPGRTLPLLRVDLEHA